MTPGRWLNLTVAAFLILVGIVAGGVIDAELGRNLDLKLTDLLGNLAGGVIGAIGAVIGVRITARADLEREDRERAREERRRRIEARGTAVAVAPRLRELEADIARVKVDLLTVTRVAATQTQALDWMGLKIPVPVMMSLYLGRMHLLGEPAGIILLQLMAYIDRYNSIVDDVNPLHPKNEGARSHALRKLALEHLKKLEEHLTLITRLIGEAMEGVQPIHDAVIEPGL